MPPERPRRRSPLPSRRRARAASLAPTEIVPSSDPEELAEMELAAASQAAASASAPPLTQPAAPTIADQVFPPVRPLITYVNRNKSSTTATTSDGTADSASVAPSTGNASTGNASTGNASTENASTENTSTGSISISETKKIRKPRARKDYGRPVRNSGRLRMLHAASVGIEVDELENLGALLVAPLPG